jgi:carboxypeptidase C (cathepsin A)
VADIRAKLQNDDKSAKARPKATPSKVARQLNTRKDEFMCKQHVQTKRLGQLAGYGAALALAAVLSAAQLAAPVLAQQNRPAAQQSADAPRPNAAEQSGRPARAQNENSPRLPADSITEHAVELPGRTLHFKATAGSIPLNDAESGNLQAEVAFVAYVLGDASRPVTFLFNGGPGAASAYLNIGAVGPWRLPLDNTTASATPPLGPNADTWLDFTDLVFIDPVLTGYSHIVASGDSVRRQLLSVEGDASALAVVIRKWVEKNGRQGAVKFLVGESSR